MSGDKATSPCNKFQANIFNKSKCQNCFKSRELHLLTDHDMEQAKPIYAGWLCLAPEGTDFDNPMQRSRKWQRRFFILYEDGSLSFALDELPSTLPQGTVNMNLCADVTDAEPRTGQRNALCIATPEQEIFIRGDNKEIINGWSEQLVVYLQTNKQSQKKKRKVEPITSQEPSPAKMAATEQSFPSSENAAESGCGRWQEDQQVRGPGKTPMWTVPDSDPPGPPEKTPAGNTSSYLCPVPAGSLSGPVGSLDLVRSGCIAPGSYNQPAESNNIQTSANNKNQSQNKSHGRSTERMLGSEATEKEQEVETAVSRRGRREARTNKREKLQSCGDIAQLTAPPPQRRARSLDRRTSDTIMPPDLLNFKKGWMVKLDESEQWKKYWFVLSTYSLRYYKDSTAEEASDLEGDIDLTTCHNVSEYQVQRNYGFQIHTLEGVYTLSAMTSGIRKNWIQALMKNVRPAIAPDVASLPGLHVPCSPPEALPKPDVTQDSLPADVSTERDSHPKHKSVMERRREGRHKTFDWAEFRPPNTLSQDPQRTKALCSLELGDLERRTRREERRRRYESMLGFPLGWEGIGVKEADVRALSPKSQQKVEEEIEKCWKQVEKTVFKSERRVPLFTEAKDSVQIEKTLEGYRKAVEDLKAQLAESERCRLELEPQLSTAGFYQQQLDHPLTSEADFCPSNTNEKPLNSSAQTLRDACKETTEPWVNIISMQQQLSSEPPQTPSIWLQDSEGNFQELGDLHPKTEDTPLLLSPASDSQHLFPQNDGQAVDLDVATINHKNRLDRDDCDQVPNSETQINNRDYSSFILELPAEGDADLPSYCEEQHLPPEQEMVRRLSQEVEQLTSQNEALNQRNQEMLNQLTEADREIERLKEELSSRYTEPHHLPEVEQLAQTRVEHLERELSSRDQQLLEAKTLITSLEENMRQMEELMQMEALLQLNVTTETEETEEEDKEYLLQCSKATLPGLQRQLDQSELTYRKLGTQTADLKEDEKRCCQPAAEGQAALRALNQELDKRMLEDGDCNGCVSGEERIRQVIDGMVLRLKALEKLLEVIDGLDFGLRKEDERKPTAESQLKWEEEFWSLLLNKLKVNPSELNEEKHVEWLLSEVTERMLVETQMLLLGHRLLSETCADEGKEGLKNLDVVWNFASETETKKTDERRTSDLNHQLCGMEHFRGITQVKISSLNHLASSLDTSAHDKLQCMADFHFSEHPMSGFIHFAATEALHCCHFSRLQSKYERQLEEAKQKLLTSSLGCCNCVDLMEENRELRERLSLVEEQQSSSLGSKLNTCCQTEETYPQDTDVELQVAGESIAGGIGEEAEMVECLEIALSCVECQSGIQEIANENAEKSMASHKETDPLGMETEQVVVLRRRVEELEEQLAVMAEEVKEELDGKMSSVQTQHEKEMEKLKATCEHSFASMEQSYLKIVEELQRRHQQEVERLLEERDRLLEEETIATATAIKAVKNAHQLELEREGQKRCQSENSTGNTHLQDIFRQHSEELCSYQRELEVLSQQFSLKCLENVHLVQALDAERKALCQCQQENQDLRNRNQELSGHLAAEITRLCSLAKQDALPHSPGMDVYEMEITLRVKESEVQCLKQEIKSLRDDLQSALRDKRNATKKYKDMYTELSITRAKTEREIDELRENLRLARHTLDLTSP
ncbi:myosin phosphatase Rho-interacting protein-like [Etheostoma cragini]|uniref:myosin phosphatase Rho-interacting protein-like n=1 Tax=Etheostoma cragini TaxID=417921 RepID=UPI00155F1B4E|nr:myosin phosphatase Rho-interacting protein-like [Etheostoma cragini]